MESDTNRIAKGHTVPTVAPEALVSNAAASDSSSFTSTQILQSKLSSIPMVRPASVASAIILLANPTYPSDEMLTGISRLLRFMGKLKFVDEGSVSPHE